MRNMEGNTGWMLISTALVLFMVPGLALFYGGMVRSRASPSEDAVIWSLNLTGMRVHQIQSGSLTDISI